MVPFDSEMDTANKVSADEFNDRRQSASSSVFRTPLQKSGSADAASLKSTPADPHLTETNGQSTSLRKYEESSDKRSTREQLSDIIIQDQSSMDSQSLSLHLNGNHTVNQDLIKALFSLFGVTLKKIPRITFTDACYAQWF